MAMVRKGASPCDYLHSSVLQKGAFALFLVYASAVAVKDGVKKNFAKLFSKTVTLKLKINHVFSRASIR